MSDNVEPNISEFHYDRVATDAQSLKRAVANRLLYSVGKDPAAAKPHDWTMALSRLVPDHLVERWMDHSRRQYQHDVKRVYYLSMEYLPGRALTNGLLALGLYDECREAIRAMGLDLEQLQSHEPDPALGNGGLGRLAACFLDSMATLGLPCYGYGIRYEYGMFAQRLREGWQVEAPDHWLVAGNPWEFPRPEVVYPIRFGGRVERGDAGARWVETDDVLAMAYDTIVPGFATKAVATLRLWSAKATEGISLSLFNQGDYARAVEDKNRSENVTRVLYPDDSTPAGRELRLRQEYFFVSASLQDVVRRYLQPPPFASSGERRHYPHSERNLSRLADKVAIHLNDTHPAIAVPELMRLLIDEHGVTWSVAWSACQQIFSYTNHTLMPEALETWPLSLLGWLLPRHLEIIFEINSHFLEHVRGSFPDEPDLIRRVSIIGENGERHVRMGHLSIIASHRVNGVSRLHSNLMRETIFRDFARIFPQRFINVTNGITPRRWLNQANRPLSGLIDSRLGPHWRRDLSQIEGLRALAGDADFLAAFRETKQINKARLAEHIVAETGVVIDPHALLDVQIKRIHEYKRQLLNVLHVITRYYRILDNPEADWLPRTVLFAGKAASSYHRAKLIIKLINDVANKINTDPRVAGRLKVVFVPNYRVTAAEWIIPAADLSEQISTAGTEASGTGNMKLALNGALTIGTEDGANIEIRDEVGADNIFIFGHNAEQIAELRERGYNPGDYYEADRELKRVLNQIGAGAFSPDDPARFHPIVDSLLRYGDHYLLLADYADYVAAQERVDALYRQPEEWARRAILNVAGMGPFSTDRTIREYAEKVWGVDPVPSVPCSHPD